MRGSCGAAQVPPSPDPVLCFQPVPADHGDTSLGLRVTLLMSSGGLQPPTAPTIPAPLDRGWAAGSYLRTCTPACSGGPRGNRSRRGRREAAPSSSLCKLGRDGGVGGQRGWGGSCQASGVGDAMCQGRVGTKVCPDSANRVMWVGKARHAKGKLRHAEAGCFTDGHRGSVSPGVLTCGCPRAEPPPGWFGWDPTQTRGAQHGVGARVGFMALDESCCPPSPRMAP